MPSPTISLCMIVKDVQDVIQACLQSVAPYVDEVVIVDTGSSDRTVDTIRAFTPGVKMLRFDPTTHPDSFLLDVEETFPTRKIPGPFTGKPMLKHFAEARQFGLDHATGDFVIWLDSDDVLEGGEKLREVVNTMVAEGLSMAFVNYDYSYDARGNVKVALWRERIFKRGCCRWNQPVHEVAYPVHNIRRFTELNVAHRNHRGPHTNYRNLKILTKWFQDCTGTPDPRLLFYLAMEERLVLPDQSLEDFRRYFPVSGWDEERATAHLYCGDILERKAGNLVGDPAGQQKLLGEAFAEYAQAATEFPANPDGLFGAARTCFFRKDWRKCVDFSERALAAAKGAVGNTVIFHDPHDRLWRPHVFLSGALISLGENQRALDVINEGLKAYPDEYHLVRNREVAEANISQGGGTGGSMMGEIRFDPKAPVDGPPMEMAHAFAVEMGLQFYKQVRRDLGDSFAMQFIERLPTKVARDPKLVAAYQHSRRAAGKDKGVPDQIPQQVIVDPKGPDIRRPPGGLKIMIWTGPAWEKWGSDSPNTTGIGGSETAAIAMARELAKRGHSVLMAGDHEGHQGVYDGGVIYTKYQNVLDNPDRFAADVLIASRQPSVITRLKATVKYVWAHDVHVGDDRAGIEAADGLFALSQWHKDFMLKCYPWLNPEKVIVTRNGIDVARFAGVPMKNGNSLIYGSSWDRGLENLLSLMPFIQEQVPDVKLHVFYGMKLWKDLAESGRANIEQVRGIEAKLAQGVQAGWLVNHGRVNQKMLAAAYMSAKVWAYPTWFTETSCITAMEAQAAGCIPVTTRLAALAETVRHGTLLEGDSVSPQYGAAFVEEVVGYLKDEPRRVQVAAEARAEFMNPRNGWDWIAAEWEALFRRALPVEIRTSSKPTPLGGILGEAADAFREVTAKDPWDFGGERLDLDKIAAGLGGERMGNVRAARPLRIAVVLGRLGEAVHGRMNVDTIFDGTDTFVTGTVSGFFNIAWGLAERGHTVDAFGQFQKSVPKSKYGGANFFRDDESVQTNRPYDVFISINEPDVLRGVPKDKLRICVQWLNDFSYCQPGYDEHVDVYAPCSQTLVNHLVKNNPIPREKFKIVPLCINPEFYGEAGGRIPGTVAYCSSPDRGLHVLLDIWPEVRRRVPTAQLRVYYRIQPWLDYFLRAPELLHPVAKNSESYRRAVQIDDQFKRLGTKGENGVIVVGPVATKAMAKELCRTEVFAYTCDPVSFTEGFSVTVLDACAAGATAIIAGVDALEEIHQAGAHIINGAASMSKQLWTDAIVAALQRPEARAAQGARGKAHAATLTRQKVAAQWEKLIMENLK